MHRSFRGTLTSRVKDMMFFVLSDLDLKVINTSSTESEISIWKSSDVVKKCYSRLFKKIKSSGHETYMSRIIDKVWKDKRNASKMQIAFAMSICQTLLNPNNLVIQINEDQIKSLCMKNYVSF